MTPDPHDHKLQHCGLSSYLALPTPGPVKPHHETRFAGCCPFITPIVRFQIIHLSISNLAPTVFVATCGITKNLSSSLIASGTSGSSTNTSLPTAQPRHVHFHGIDQCVLIHQRGARCVNHHDTLLHALELSEDVRKRDASTPRLWKARPLVRPIARTF